MAADVWVVLDDVQFTRRDYQHRARLAGVADPNLQQWLTLPVQAGQGRSTLIRDVELIQPAASRRRLVRLTQQYYGRSRHWPIISDLLDQVISRWNTSDRLSEVAETSTLAMLRALGWTGVMRRSRDIPACLGRSQRLADLTVAVGASVYLCGTGGARYLDAKPFNDMGVAIRYLSLGSIGASDVWTGGRTISALRAFAVARSVDVVQALHEVSWMPG